MSGAPVAGSTLVAIIYWNVDTSETFTGVTDAAGNAYTKVAGIITGGTGGEHMAVYRKFNAAVVGSHTVTATWSAATAAPRLIAIEVKGAATAADSFDVQAPMNNYNGQASPSGTDSVTSTAATTTADGEFVLGVAAAGDASALTPGTGFTNIVTVSNNLKAEYRVQTTAASTAATWTSSGGVRTIAEMATFKSAPLILSPPIVDYSNFPKPTMRQPLTPGTGRTN